jgi:phage terminase large subunit GpA-like protein
MVEIVDGRPPFASAKVLVREALQLLLPPTRDTVDEYAAKHRLIPRRRGDGFTLWDHNMAPFLVGPMRCLTSYRYLTTCIVGPGQSGKTALAENAILHAVAKQPRDTLWYMQTDEGIEAYVKDRINPMIRAHEELRERIGEKPEDNTLHYKRFDGMRIQFLSATHSNLISKSSAFIVADEIDAYDPSIGNVMPLLDVRRQTYGRLSMVLAMSHPDLALGLEPVKHWRSGIMQIYADSDRRVWYWPCPYCGAWSSPVPTAKRVMTLEWPHDGTLAEIERQAHLLCPVNGCVIEDKQRRAMNLAAYRSPFGGWLGTGQEITEDGTVSGELAHSDTAGFWFVGVMSPFLLKGIGGLARELVKAQREYEISGDDKTVKEVTVKQVGIPYTIKGPVGSIDAETLAERALNEEQPLGIVPLGVRFLTAWIDIQIAHFEILVRGWGVDAESWVIFKDRMPADTATDAAAWEALLEELINRRFPLASDSSRGMAIRALGYDSGGAPGTTDQANKVWIALRRLGLVRNFGMLDGRDVWSMVPTKGASSPNAPRLQVVYPDNQRKDRKIAQSGTVPLARFNANTFKDNLSGHLMQAAPGPSYVHIPAALRSKEPPHIVFEQMVSEKRDANGRWTKPHQGVRNEMLDLMVGTHVLAWLHGLGRIKWPTPPIWAAEWDKNSMIGPMDAAPAGAPSPASSSANKSRRTFGSVLKGKS